MTCDVKRLRCASLRSALQRCGALSSRKLSKNVPRKASTQVVGVHLTCFQQCSVPRPERDASHHFFFFFCFCSLPDEDFVSIQEPDGGVFRSGSSAPCECRISSQLLHKSKTLPFHFHTRSSQCQTRTSTIPQKALYSKILRLPIIGKERKFWTPEKGGSHKVPPNQNTENVESVDTTAQVLPENYCKEDLCNFAWDGELARN